MTFVEYHRSVRELYKRLSLPLALRPPAAPANLERAAEALGTLPNDDLIAAWRIADGGPTGAPFFARPESFIPFDFISIAEGLEHRAVMRKRAGTYGEYSGPARDPRIRSGWFHHGWLPFGNFAGGTALLILDMTPSDLGRPGQIIAFEHDPDAIEYVAESFASLLPVSLGAMRKNPEEYFFEYL